MVKLHHIWLGGRLPRNYEELRDEAIRLNPDFDCVLWYDDNLRAEFGAEYHKIKDTVNGLSKQSNIFRLMVLQRFGGVYMDLDFKHLRPLSNLTLKGCIIGNSEDFGHQGAFIYADKGHPILDRWLASPDIASPIKSIEEGMVDLEGVEILPSNVFYSRPYVDRGTPLVDAPEDAVAVHLWNGHWRRESNVLTTIPFQHIPAVVISLEDNQDRRDALDLPFDYQLRLQKRISGVNVASERVRGNIGCNEAHKDAVRHARARDWPAVLVIEDDAVWQGDSVEEIECDAPITFLGADPIEQTEFDPETRIAKNVVRTTAVIYRKDAYDKVLGLPLPMSRLRESNIPVGATPIDVMLSRDGVKLSKRKLFRHSGAPSTIGHGELTTTDQELYARNLVFIQPFDCCSHQDNCRCSDIKSYIPHYKRLLEAIKPKKVFEWGPSETGNTKMAIDSGAKVFAIEQCVEWIPNFTKDVFECYHIQPSEARYTDLHGHTDCDIYFVDSRRRADCLKTVASTAKPSAVACLHDASRSRYAPGLKLFKYVCFMDKGFAFATNSKEQFSHLITVLKINSPYYEQ